MRGAIRDFIEATTPYKVCDTVGDDTSAIQKATESCCDLILLHLRAALSYGVETASQRYFGKPAAQLSLGEAALAHCVDTAAGRRPGYRDVARTLVNLADQLGIGSRYDAFTIEVGDADQPTETPWNPARIAIVSASASGVPGSAVNTTICRSLP